MNYTPKIIKRILKKCINEISAHPELFAKNPGKDFIRERKLPFDQILKSVLSMTGKSLRGELMDYFNLSISMPTVSAFVQQRNKIDFRAFEILFSMFYEAIDEQKLFKGYRLLAVDGSDLHTPTNKDEKDSFFEGTNGQKPYNLLHLNALYDANFDFLPKTSRKSIPMSPYYISFRLVRFKLTEDTYELLITNLAEDEFDVNELKELYAMRWGIKPLSEI